MDVNDYDKVKKKIVEITDKEVELETELSQIEEEQKKYIKELAMIEAQTEKQLDEINVAKREESTVNEEELHKKCKEVIEYFLQDIAAEQQFGFSLPIRIEYQQMTILKNIVDENITFEKLKEETKNQFGKEFDEFFFADENGNIFLNSQRVTPSLFPLSNVKVDKYEPVIYVVNKISYKSNQINDTTKDYVDFSKKKEPTKSWTKLFSQYFKKNSIRLYFAILMIIFTGLYSQNCIDYRQAKEYRAISNSLNPLAEAFKSKLSMAKNPNETDNNFLDTLVGSLSILLDIPQPPVEQTHNTFQMSMLKMNSIKLIRKHKTKCLSGRIDLEVNPCNNAFQINEEYSENPSYLSMKGIYNNYDNNGEEKEIIIKDKNKQELEDEIKPWVNDSTATIILLMNYYSVNYHTIITLRFLLENITDNFLISYDHLTVYLDQSINGFLIACILISIVILVLLFFSIKQDKEAEQKNPSNPNSCCFGLSNMCSKCSDSFQTHFRCPTKLELFSLLNILFFYGLLIFRFSFLSNTDPINQSDKYEDFQEIAYLYELVTVSSCFNLFFFYIIILGLLGNYIDEFSTIVNAISSYFKQIFPFVILFILPFILISMFISYMMFGDYYITHYRQLMFIFLKVLQSFFRGSLDHTDYPKSDINNDKGNAKYKSLELAKTQYEYLMEGSGVTGYILYSLLYFLVCLIVIKGFVIGQFYFFYRNQYIHKLIDEAKQKKEEKLAERAQLRNEEKKIEEKERKINDEEEEVEDDIGITLQPNE